jgi:EmrB/QacA subfamily drug resistance transporter
MSQPAAVAESAASPPLEPYRWRWVALFAILGVEVMDLLDALVTNIAAPSVRADLGGTATLVQWLGAGYTLAMAVGLLTGGRLGDIFGRKQVFLVGAAGFTAASLLCSLAQSPEMLIGSRVLQGLFGAVVLPQGLGMIKEMFPPKEMAAAFGAFGPVMGLSSVGGPILAGALIDADLFGTGWRAIFLINVPIGLAILAVSARYLPKYASRHASTLDFTGVLLAGLGAAALIYPLVQGRELDWPLWCFALIALSVVLFGVFAWHERRISARGQDPLVEPSLFRKRAFSGGLVSGLMFFSSLIGFSLVFTLYVQIGLGYSPLKASLAGTPMAIGSVIGFVVAGVGLAEKLGRRLIHAGVAIMLAGSGGLLATVHWVHVGSSPWPLAPSLVVVGLGMGLAMAPFFDIVLAGVEAKETGTAGGALTAIQQLGGALGIAVLGTIFFSALGGHIADRSTAAGPALRAQLSSAGVPSGAQAPIVNGLRECGRDRATAKDPVAVPESCRRVESAVRTVATSPESARAIGGLVQAAGQGAARQGFGDALQIALGVEMGALAVTFGLTFLLPLRARPREE